MITNITLENFKCFRHVSINPKRLTVLIGPNGTGKSSVLQALLLLKQSVDTDRINHQGEYVNFYDPGDLIPKFLSEPLAIHFGIGCEGPEIFRGATREYLFSRDYNPNLRLASDNSKEINLLGPMPMIFSSNGVPFGRIRSVPAIRGLVRPTYSLRDRSLEQITLRHGLSDQEEQLATNLGYGRSSEEKISASLERVTGTGLRTDAIPPNAVSVKSIIPLGTVNMVSEGFGTNALIQLLLQLFTSDKGATVLIEEPEIHLHPKAQADLAEVLAETAKAEDKQIIMTTHSEHIAGRLLTLVAENRLTTDELAIYSFEKDAKGECTATELEITELGQTAGGLTGFFDTNLEEMDRYVKALQNRS